MIRNWKNGEHSVHSYYITCEVIYCYLKEDKYQLLTYIAKFGQLVKVFFEKKRITDVLRAYKKEWHKYSVETRQKEKIKKEKIKNKQI